MYRKSRQYHSYFTDILTIFATQSLTHETAVILPLIPSAKFNKGELINVFGANHTTNYFSLHSVTPRCVLVVMRH